MHFRIGFESFGFGSKLVLNESSAQECSFESDVPLSNLTFKFPKFENPIVAQSGPPKAGGQHCTGPRLPNGAELAMPRRHRSLSPLTAPLDARAHAFHECVMFKNG